MRQRLEELTLSTIIKMQINNQQVELFLELLEKAGVIERQNFAALEQHQTPEDIYDVLELTTSNEKLTEVYAKFRDLPFVQINTIDPKAIEIIDKELARKFGFIPFFVDSTNRILQVAITDPRKYLLLDRERLSALGQKLGYKIEIMMASKNQVEKALYSRSYETVEGLSEMRIPDVIFNQIPLDLAIKYQVVAFERDDRGIIKLACANPNSEKIVDIVNYLQTNAAQKTEIYYAPAEEIQKVLDQHKGKSDISKQVHASESTKPEITESEMGVEIKLSSSSVEDIKKYSEQDDPSSVVEAVVSYALQNKSSDIHFEPFEKSLKIRIRVDGIMEEIISLPNSLLPGILSKAKLLGHLKIEEQRIPQDGRFDTMFLDQKVDIRISTIPTIFGEKIAMRLLPKTKNLADLETLGLDGRALDKINKVISEPYGVIIAAGPTGSGKTTTLYSILNKLNKKEVDIITLEDTLEYELSGVNQVRLSPHLGFGYAEGIRSVLKQDPNIIYVGEVLDKETAELVIHASLTGRMVLTTLHTNNASEAFARLNNLGVEPFLLTSALKVIIGQRLVRKLCQKCKEQVVLPQAVLANIQKELEELNLNMQMTFYRAKGCGECKSGYSGRIGIFEVLEVNHDIEELILGKRSPEEIVAAAKKQGFVSMRQDGFIKALKGITSVDEVIRSTTLTEG